MYSHVTEQGLSVSMLDCY